MIRELWFPILLIVAVLAYAVFYNPFKDLGGKGR